MNFGRTGDTCNCFWGCFNFLQSHPLTFSSSIWDVALGDSSEQMLNFSEVMSETFIQGWWKHILESGFVGWCVSSSLNCFLEAGVSQRTAGFTVRPPPFLSDALSLLSQLWLVTWGAHFFRARLQLSLFTGGLLCVFSVQTV